MRYVAFLRGINVGGKALIKMPALKAALEDAGFADVRTYIQSGNVLFSASSGSVASFNRRITQTIASHFGLDVATTTFSATQWKKVVASAPEWWGIDPEWKHNIWILLEGTTTRKVIDAIGPLRDDIEVVVAGNRVVYQSMSFVDFGKTSTGKISKSPQYKLITIRNYNTATKLAALFED